MAWRLGSRYRHSKTALHIGLYYTIPPQKALETIIRYDLKDLNKFTFVLTPLCLHIKAAMCVWPCGRTVAKRVCSAACGSWANTSAEQKTSLIWRFAVFGVCFLSKSKTWSTRDNADLHPGEVWSTGGCRGGVARGPWPCQSAVQAHGQLHQRFELVFLGSKCSEFGEAELSKQIPCHFQVCESLVWTWAASRSCCRVAAIGWQQWGDAEMCQKNRK